MTMPAKKPDLKVAPEPGEAPEQSGEHQATAAGLEPAPARRSLGARIGRGVLQMLLPLAVIAGGVATYQYLKATKPEVKGRQPRPAVYAVQTVPVRFADVRPELRLYGTTVAGRQVEIRSLVAGQVVTTSDDLREGGVLRAGEPILSIDPFNFKADIDENRAQSAESEAKIKEFKAALANEESSLAFAKEQARLAQVDLDRAQPLSRRGAVSERTVDDRRLILSQRRQAVSVIENNIAVWQARIAQQEAALNRLRTARERAEKRLAETRLTAPFNAYVTEVGAQVGRMVGVNDRVATLIDMDWIEVSFLVTDNQFGRLARGDAGIEGRQVEVRWNVGDKPFIYKGKIERVGAKVTTEAGGVQVFARVENPTSGVNLRPGVFVELRVPDTEFTNVVRLPSTAIFAGDTVYVVEEGKLTARTVSIVGTIGPDLLVRGNIKAGEKIMTTRLSLPGDGVRVREIKSSRDTANVN